MENGKKNNNSNKTLESISLQLSALLEMGKKQEEKISFLENRLNSLEDDKKTVSFAVGEGTVNDVPSAEVEDSSIKEFKADRMVEIVHLADRAQGITTTLMLNDGRTLTFRKYGDTVRIRYFEFQQLISTYYDLFYKERVFTLGKDDQDIALAERLPTFDEQCLTKEEARSLVSLTPKKLEEVYNRVCDTHKELILSTWQRGYYMHEDPEYANLDKVNALNKVSNNRLSSIYDNIVNPIAK